MLPPLFYKGARENYLDCAEKRPKIGNFSHSLGIIGVDAKTLQRRMLDTSKHPTSPAPYIASSPWLRPKTKPFSMPSNITPKHSHEAPSIASSRSSTSIIDWRAGEAVIEEKHSKQFHC